MSKSNSERLRAGLDVYLTGMREFIKRRLLETYRDGWWQEGVQRVLTDPMKRDLQRCQQRSPGSGKLQCLGAREIAVVITKNFDKSFSQFVDFGETRARLDLVVAARNKWAHPGADDLPDEEVTNHLFTMRLLLSRAGLEDAAAEIDIPSPGLATQTPPEPVKTMAPTEPTAIGVELPGPVISANVSVTSAGRDAPARSKEVIRASASANHEVMIQDVNVRNARIFFDGYMYVGGIGMVPRPSYFAPYLILECENSPNVPEVQDRGISWFSDVFTVREEPTDALIRNAVAPQLDQKTRGHQHWERWQLGLRNIRQRAIDERWSGIHRLYFLLEPQRLDHIIKKRGWMPRIPWGFGTTLDRLKGAQSLRELSS